MQISKKAGKFRKGATFIEYAMLAGLVAVVVAVAALFFGDEIKQLFATTGEKTEQIQKSVDKVDLTPDTSIKGKDPEKQ